MLDFSDALRDYQSLVASVDAVCGQLSQKYAQAIRCKEGCTDCCHALFDIPLIEALALNRRFSELPDSLQQSIWIEADKVDRSIERIKRRLYKEHHDQGDTGRTLHQASRERVRCPLLGEDDRCILYIHRPITCRIYGFPLDIHGRGCSCGFSGFVAGQQYPSIKVAAIQDRLVALSEQLLARLGSPYHDFATMFVPVSRAVLTHYDAVFFGLVAPEDEVAGGGA
jgi:Fe-S-cluster containining protein